MSIEQGYRNLLEQQVIGSLNEQRNLLDKSVKSAEEQREAEKALAQKEQDLQIAENKAGLQKDTLYKAIGMIDNLQAENYRLSEAYKKQQEVLKEWMISQNALKGVLINLAMELGVDGEHYTQTIKKAKEIAEDYIEKNKVNIVPITEFKNKAELKIPKNNQ